MVGRVGIRELRQDLSRDIERVEAGEVLVATDRGREVARRLSAPGAPAGTTDEYLAESRGER
jgi:antitoxin (DNA-binding transcriptional repressor) of toxin-antitoxin stability system